MAVLEAFANQEAPARHILASALAKGKESMLYSLEGAPECETLEWMVSIATLAKLPANNGSAIRQEKTTMNLKDRAFTSASSPSPWCTKDFNCTALVLTADKVPTYLLKVWCFHACVIQQTLF